MPECPAGSTHDHAGSGDYCLMMFKGRFNWKHCCKCQALFYNVPGSVCPGPEGGEHDPTGSGNYALSSLTSETSSGQGDWLSCSGCQGLFYTSNGTCMVGVCPAGGTHNGRNGRYDYSLLQRSQASRDGQDGWRWCRKCQTLFFGDQGTSCCPSGGPHDRTGSDDYVLFQFRGEDAWNWCRNCRVLFNCLSSGQACPMGGQHNGTSSANYIIPSSKDEPSAQPDWRQCTNCQGLYYGGHTSSICPAGGQARPHSNNGKNYAILQASQTSASHPPAQLHITEQSGWRWCNKCQALCHT